MSTVPTEDLLFREGGVKDLRGAFELSQLALAHVGRLPESPPTGAELDTRWAARRPLSEFMAAQDGSFFLCERQDELVGFARTVSFPGMDQLAELFVHPDHQRRGIGRGLLERCWPGPPTAERARMVVAMGEPADLTLYTGFGLMPANGRLGMVERTERYVERRVKERDKSEPGVHALEPEKALTEWKRLEPAVVAHERKPLADFLARERTCLACMGDDGAATSLCWVSPTGAIGPGVAERPEDLVPVVLAALDRVAKSQAPELLGVYCTTDAWWLLDRLRRLGFHLYWPSWVMSSVPLPGLDRYLPTRPPRLL